MNTKTLIWVFKPANKVESEMVQRVAFTFGYAWSFPGGRNVHFTNVKYLLFIPENKCITCSNDESVVKRDACRVVTDMNEAVQYFTDPVTVKLMKMKEVVEVENLTAYDDGSVSAGEVPLDAGEFDGFVKKRNALLGRKPSMPVLSFDYKKEGPTTKRYKIDLISDEIEWFAGLDLNDNKQYKKFLRSKVIGPIMYLGMTESK
jgi:hypothetical protein